MEDLENYLYIQGARDELVADAYPLRFNKPMCIVASDCNIRDDYPVDTCRQVVGECVYCLADVLCCGSLPWIVLVLGDGSEVVCHVDCWV